MTSSLSDLQKDMLTVIIGHDFLHDMQVFETPNDFAERKHVSDTILDQIRINHDEHLVSAKTVVKILHLIGCPDDLIKNVKYMMRPNSDCVITKIVSNYKSQAISAGEARNMLIKEVESFSFIKDL